MKQRKETLNEVFERMFVDPTEKQAREHIQKGFEKAFGQVFESLSAPKKVRPTEKVTIRIPEKPAEEDLTFEEMFNSLFKQEEKSPGTNEIDELLADLDSELKEEEVPLKQTLVVNLFAGPGTGKSTICSGIFFDLKNMHIESEIANEYAKELVWEKRTNTFNDQIYLFAKQYHKIFRLLGQVDVVVTDCPILLSPVYDASKRKTLERLIVEEHNNMWTYNVFLKRKKTYNPNGRIHTEAQAHAIDLKVADVLSRNNIPFEVFEADTRGKDLIVLKILTLLRWNKAKLQRESSNARRVKKI